ncbi:hypothetical protein FOL46_006918 [Perkinsus olseni]|uniref:Uncharacterized protein n=1 Tax=Perkinsus olseni TaxID=32597 RepID=A0A7J6MQQ0_PEROL|nr:hypothetical protein FOL46_006918 [Perkinsus olseni]
MVALAYSAVCMRQDKMAPYLKTCGTKIAKCSSGGAGGPPDLAACADAMKVCESVTLGPLKKKKGTSIECNLSPGCGGGDPPYRYFYVIIEADKNPETSPTFLLIGGGLGSSSSIGTATRLLGPCRMDPKGETQLLNLYSWTEDANSIWVDAPAPTRFSEGPIESKLSAVAVNLANFLWLLFKDHGNLNRDLHLVGSSASASVVAMLGSIIMRKPQLKINLKGVIMRYGVVGPLSIYHGCLTMAKERRLLPAEELEKMAEDLKTCETKIAKCNSGGPGGPPDLGRVGCQ